MVIGRKEGNMAALYHLYEDPDLIIINGQLYTLMTVRPGSRLDEVCDELVCLKERGGKVACRFNGVLIHSDMRRSRMVYKVENEKQDWML